MLSDIFPYYSWLLLIVSIILLVFVDLRIFALKSIKNFSVENVWIPFIMWFFVALLLGILIYFYTGIQMATEYMTAYFVELLLSVDNAFIFLLIFKYFGIDSKYQHKVLMIGALSAAVFRLIILPFGFYIIHMVEWILIPFALLLFYSGYKLPHIEVIRACSLNHNLIVKLAKRYLHYSSDYSNGELFFIRDQKYFITPLTLSLLAIEKADLVFALDSIPAVLAITQEPFIAFSSSILAVLGLRSMYFIISDAIQKYRYLKHGIGYIIMYIGLKMFLSFFNIYFPDYISILIIVLFIFFSIILSVIKNNAIKN